MPLRHIPRQYLTNRSHQRQIHRSPPSKRRLRRLHQRYPRQQTRRRGNRPRDLPTRPQIHRSPGRRLRNERSRTSSTNKRQRTRPSKHHVRPPTSPHPTSLIPPTQGRQRRHSPSQSPPRTNPGRFRAHVPHQRLRRAQLPLHRRQTIHLARHLLARKSRETPRSRFHRSL
jgi:hypothetical protein